MSSHDIFYDSLDETDTEETESFFSTQNTLEEIDQIVPLYSGEIPKDQITPTKKRSEKVPKPLNPFYLKPKKSYLAMYYEKQNRLMDDKNKGNGTNRAVCDNLTPRRENEVEDLVGCQSNPDSDLDEDFYKKILDSEMAKRPTSPSPSSKFSSNTSLSLKAPIKAGPARFYFGTNEQERIEKLEQLKKRQSYGTMMSKKNKIRIEELKSLKKIKNSNLGHV